MTTTTTTIQRHSSRQAGDSNRSTPARRQLGSALRIAAVAVLLILSGPQPQQVSATGALAPTATFVVDRFDDSNAAAAQVCSAAANDCSLRGAIITANAAAGVDTITLPAGTYTLSLVSGGAFENAAASGDLDINDSVTINGAGSAITIIATTYTSTCGDCKVFGINQDGTHTNLAVSMGGLRISGGYNNGTAYCGTFFETGGGIDLYMTGGGGSFALSDVILTNNRAAGCVQSYGGGINIDTDAGNTGSVTMTNVQITNNTADSTGGGINFFGGSPSLTINATSAISGNSTLGPGGIAGSGGGINIRTTNGGSVAIHGTTIANNNAMGSGGGVAIGASNQASVVIDNTGAAASITGNTSLANGGIASQGGGLYKGDTATASLINVTLSGNHADQISGPNNPHGGAIYQEGGGVLTVTGGTLDGSGGTGELFALNSTATATVRGATIQNATTVFVNLSTATLRAYANNIPTYTAAFAGSGTPAIGHNYWGTNNPAATTPTGMPGSEWPKRLGAPVSSWADGSAPAGASLSGASLTGGTAGTLVVVSHGRGAIGNVPFGNGIAPYANQTCSDYYDYFTLSGSGTFTALVPVDNNANCNTNTLTPRKVFWVTNLATCSSSTPNTQCWNWISSGTSMAGQAIQITGLTNANLGGTPFVAGDPTGLDPTAVTLMNLSAAEITGANAGGMALLALVALMGAGVLIWAMRRRTRA